MSLTRNTRLGPYEIADPLGAGGMGEVYRARDTRLDRDVAIKVLPAHLSRSPEFKHRFEREAKSISQLTHAHICTLYDVGHHDGTDFLVMELLEGETLAQRLTKGALPIDQVLRHGVEIASALDAAHRKGVVHRDLKPGNIMLTKSGAKLLDFGLAKSTTIIESDPSAVTVSQPLTSKGTIVGTFQYMSPEQLEGTEADARTDIFAFGAVLYEMATGKRAFEGASRASLIASIMSVHPQPISNVQPMTPPALDRLVRKCLAKAPDARWQNAADLADELRWISESSAQASGAAIGRRSSGRPSLRMWLTWGLTTAAVVIAAVWANQRSGTKSDDARTLHLSLLPSTALDIDVEPANVAISPDGAYLVFVASQSQEESSLWVRPFNSRTAQELPGTEGGYIPFWSPDSRSIGFFAGGKLKKIARDGGAAQVLCDAPSGRGGDWSRGNVILFAPSSGGTLHRVSANGGVPVTVTQLDAERGENAHRFPCFLPDGEHFLYVTLPSRLREFPVRIGSLDGAQPRDLMSASGAPRYAPPGILVFQKPSGIVAQEFDPVRLELKGDPVPIPEAPSVATHRSGASTFSVSNNSLMVIAAGHNMPTKLVWLDREGRQEGQIPLPDASYTNAVFSPDGNSLAAVRSSVDTDDVLRIDLFRGVATRLTFGREENRAPLWSPDGKWIVFASNRDDSQSLYRVPATGGATEELVVKLGGNFNEPRVWSLDGTSIVYRALDADSANDLWLVSLSEGHERTPLVKTPFSEGVVSLSPDGRWMAYYSDESGRNELYVQSFPTPGQKTQVSTEGANASAFAGFSSIWWRRQDEILYVSRDTTTVLAAAVETGESVKVGATQPLFKLPQGTIELTASPDGKRFLATMLVPGRAQSALSVVVNWDAGPRKP